MANNITKNLREFAMELQGLDIPYDAEGFVKWLMDSVGLSKEDAAAQVQFIREADIELWSPEAPEIFQIISEWINEAQNARSETVRTLLYDFVFDMLQAQIDELHEIDGSVKKKNKPFLHSVLKAYEYYMAFMKSVLNYSPTQLIDEDDFSEESKKENPEVSAKRYPAFHLEKEYGNYLTEWHFPAGTRYKMLTNLRKLNSLIINNGRGDSDWLKIIVEKARSGKNIRYTRVIAHKLVHNALSNIDSSDTATKSFLRGGLTSLNHYIDFVIRTYCKSDKKTN